MHENIPFINKGYRVVCNTCDKEFALNAPNIADSVALHMTDHFVKDATSSSHRKKWWCVEVSISC